MRSRQSVTTLPAYFNDHTLLYVLNSNCYHFRLIRYSIKKITIYLKEIISYSLSDNSQRIFSVCWSSFNCCPSKESVLFVKSILADNTTAVNNRPISVTTKKVKRQIFTDGCSVNLTNWRFNIIVENSIENFIMPIVFMNREPFPTLLTISACVTSLTTFFCLFLKTFIRSAEDPDVIQ